MSGTVRERVTGLLTVREVLDELGGISRRTFYRVGGELNVIGGIHVVPDAAESACGLPATKARTLSRCAGVSCGTSARRQFTSGSGTFRAGFDLLRHRVRPQ